MCYGRLILIAAIAQADRTALCQGEHGAGKRDRRFEFQNPPVERRVRIAVQSPRARVS